METTILMKTSVFVKDKRFNNSRPFLFYTIVYSDRFISPSFNEIVKEIKHGTELTEDKLTTGQIKYLKRQQLFQELFTIK